MGLNQLTVLHVNKVHYISGGAEAIYFRTAEILEKNGHSSVFFAMRHPDNLYCDTADYFMPLIDISKRNVINYVKASCRNLYSFKARKYISRLLDKYPVDIVHMHDIHRQMSPSILHEIKKRRIPVVMTLHNYKMICPSFLMMFKGKPCEACDQGKYFNAMKLRCVKDSFFRSMLLSMELYLHHKILDIYKNIDIFIAPSMFLKNKHEEMGFRKKIIHLPNPFDVKQFDNYYSENESMLNKQSVCFAYFGRLVPDKGLFTLIEAIRTISCQNKDKAIEFKIIGDGPIREQLKKRVQEEGIINVQFLRFLKGGKLFKELKKVDGIILPSEWYENCPVSVMEAFAMKKPVIGARIGGIPEMIKNGVTGLTFESGNVVDLSEKMQYVMNNRAECAIWGGNAREFIEREASPEKYYQKLMEIYKMATSRK